MKYPLAIFIFTLALIFFIILEYGRLPDSLNGIIQPIIFAIVVVLIFIKGQYRQAILWMSSMLFFLMVFFYFLNQIPVSNWVGSLGIGILVILIFSYLPQLIKNGHI